MVPQFYIVGLNPSVTIYRVNDDEFDEVYASTCSSRQMTHTRGSALETLIPIGSDYIVRTGINRAVARCIRSFLKYHTLLVR